MGWIWASSKPQDKPPTETLQKQPPPPPPSTDPPPLSETLPPFTDPAETQQEPRSSPQNRYEFADAEFRAFFRELADEEAAALPLSANPFKKLFRISKPPATDPHQTSTSLIDTNDDIDEPPAAAPQQDLQITPAHLFPKTMSCQSAFDAAFYCQSLGGQFNAVYHYGTIRDCSALWSQFWFCVKTNQRPMSEEERQQRVIERYQMREMKYREGPSSEDVWVQRTTMVVGAFEGDHSAAIWAEEQRRRGAGVRDDDIDDGVDE